MFVLIRSRSSSFYFYSIGFAAFAFILAFLTFTIGGIYYSPLFCGSAQEKQEMRQAASAGGANQV